MSERSETDALTLARRAMGSTGSARPTRAAAPRPRAVAPERMQIHRVRGRDLVDALERAAKQHGGDVVVLSREPAPGGGVTVAVARPAVARPAPEVDPGRLDVERHLERHGAGKALIARVLAAVDSSGARGAFAIDAAAAALGTLVRVAPSPRVPGRVPAAAPRAPHVIAFVGPAGVGKTTTLVKLAARLVKSRRRIALVSTDVNGVAGTARLEAYGKLLQVPVLPIHGGEELARAVLESRAADAVLVDTAGHSPVDAAALASLSAGLSALGDGSAEGPGLDVYLTAAGTTARAALDEALLAFEATRPTALVLTKLDETRQPAPALEFAQASGLPLAFLCDGAEIARHLHRPSPDAWADLYLRGRLS